MTTESPDRENHSNALVLMSQPLKSSWARRPSSRYTAWGPPPWNSMWMLRPIAGDGTSTFSTGRPFLEYACAVPECATTPARPGSTANPSVATTASRRAQVRHIVVPFLNVYRAPGTLAVLARPSRLPGHL